MTFLSFDFTRFIIWSFDWSWSSIIWIVLFIVHRVTQLLRRGWPWNLFYSINSILILPGSRFDHLIIWIVLKLISHDWDKVDQGIFFILPIWSRFYWVEGLIILHLDYLLNLDCLIGYAAAQDYASFERRNLASTAPPSTPSHSLLSPFNKSFWFSETFIHFYLL